MQPSAAAAADLNHLTNYNVIPVATQNIHRPPSIHPNVNLLIWPLMQVVSHRGILTVLLQI
jgi:hypothetical protein